MVDPTFDDPQKLSGGNIPTRDICEAFATRKLGSSPDPILRIAPGGTMSGGVQYEVDIIAFAAGFKANDYLWPMQVRGKGGGRIDEVWTKDGPRGYLHAMVPRFPNLFMCYGTNSNNFGGFTVVDLLELAAAFWAALHRRLD
jgi:4-hydroxyacetophenone monooxygenase